MANPLMHIIINLVVWIVGNLIVQALGFELNTKIDLWWFLLGGIIFDIDHAIYFGFTTKPLNYMNIKQRIAHDYQNNNPHFYIFHTIEFLTFGSIIAFVFPNLIWQSLICGWTIHIIVDIGVYIKVYRSIFPWMPYFSAIYYFGFNQSKNLK